MGGPFQLAQCAGKTRTTKRFLQMAPTCPTSSPLEPQSQTDIRHLPHLTQQPHLLRCLTYPTCRIPPLVLNPKS